MPMKSRHLLERELGELVVQHDELSSSLFNHQVMLKKDGYCISMEEYCHRVLMQGPKIKELGRVIERMERLYSELSSL